MDSVSCLRTFLDRLPTLCGARHDQSVKFLLWKAIHLSAEHGTQNVNWPELIEVFTSEEFRNGTLGNILSNETWEESFIQIQDTNTHHGVCNRICFPPETVYYCFTCTLNPIYEICEECFDESKHVGHTYTARTVTRAEGKICHCGDPAVFKKPELAYCCKSYRDPGYTPDLTNKDGFLLKTINILVDFLIEYSLKQPNLSLEAPENNEFTNNKNKKPLKDVHLMDSMTDGAEIMDTSTGDMTNFELEQEPTWAITIRSDDCDLHYIDLASRVSDILNIPNEYAIGIVDSLQDDCSIVTLVESNDLSKIKALADEFYSKNVNVRISKLESIFNQLLIEDIICYITKRCLLDKGNIRFKHLLRLSLIDIWNSELPTKQLNKNNNLNPYSSKINLLGGFLVSSEQNPDNPWFKKWSFPEIKDNYVQMVISNYNQRIDEANSPDTLAHFYTLYGSRMQYLLSESLMLFCSVTKRQLLKIVNSVFSISDNCRKFVAAQYLDIYLTLLYKTVASDTTGFRVCTMSLISQQIFLEPTYAAMAIESGFIERTLKFAFTLMYFESDDLLPYLSIPLHSGFQLPQETIKSRRTIICFKDLCCVMSTNRNPLLLLQREETFNAVLKTFEAFSAILPLKRETSEHVEFENFDFSAFYFFFSSCLIMMDGYIRNLSMVEDKNIRAKIAVRMLELVMENEFTALAKSRSEITSGNMNVEKLPGNIKLPTYNKLPFLRERICNHVSEVVNFQVGIDTQNLFNPMAYMFKFVLQWARCGRYEPLNYNGNTVLDLKTIFEDKQKALYISESSLATLVLIGQVRVGFWVRNGTPMTHQIRMYTKYSMREFTYFSDFFNVQFSMAIADPNEFMVTYLYKWGLKHWSNGIPNCDYPDMEITLSIVEEALILLIQLLTDMKSIVVISSIDSFEKTLKTEIIHAIGFQSFTYSQIMAMIPEHITKHNAFDIALKKYTTYSPPSGLSDSGLFSLRDDLKCEIDPYYIGLPNGKRYEIEQQLRKHISAIKDIPYELSFVPAKRVIDDIKESAFPNLFAITSKDTFGLFIKNSLDHIKKFENEGLLHRILHLIHICVVNNVNDFANIFWREYAIVDTEYCNDHSIGSILYSCLFKDCFSDLHGKIKEIFSIFNSEAAHINVEEYLKEQTVNFNPKILVSSDSSSCRDEEFERKKKLAMIRKEKMLRKLAKQQKKFMKLNREASCEDSLPTTATNSSEDLLMCDDKMGTPEILEETCVFCKMYKDDDQFIYFAYLERNICDKGVCTGHQYGQEETMVTDSVVRACGHGAHTKCLAHHMKSARLLHNQTTKNVPIAYGMGLIYCPLCAALCNCIIPHITNNNASISNLISANKTNSFSFNELFEDSISEIVIKSGFIFSDLCNEKYSKEDNLNHLFITVSRLLYNTVANFELRIRRNLQKGFYKKSGKKYIPNMGSLSSRLLNDMRVYMIKYMSKHDVTIKLEDSFLAAACLVADSVTGKELGSNVPTMTISKIQMDIDAIVSHIATCEFSDESESDIDMFDISSKEEVMAQTCGYLLGHGCEKAVQTKLERIDIWKRLRDSALVFLRRLFILSNLASEKITLANCEQGPDHELSFYSEYFCIGLELPQLVEQAVNQWSATGKQCSEFNIVCTNTPLQLYSIPRNLSNYEKDLRSSQHLMLGRSPTDTTDLALCLMCGEHVRTQRLVSRLGYEIGECTNHCRNECSMATPFGTFLLVRSNAIYIAYGNRGVFYPGPYLNEFGERDVEFKYGTPVYLNQQRYEHFCDEILLGNMIPHVVFRLTDGNADLGGWETM